MPKALVSRQNKTGEIQSTVEQSPSKNLTAGQVRIKAHFSSLNYKDALGVTGKGQIFKSLPITGGIDVSGEIVESASSRFKIGDHVLVTGCGLGETRDGGYTEEVIEDNQFVVPIPNGLSTKDVMIFGTAGFTAALALHRMLVNGQTPDKGPILITGASGGVGQFAIEFFSKSGFEVWALSEKKESHERLRQLGATSTMTLKELKTSSRPMDKAVYGGIVDNVGGDLLSKLIPHVNLWGNIACVGLAGGAELHTTVLPMILRGVSLLGTSSNNTSWDLRLKLWADLAGPLKPKDLAAYVSRIISLDEVVATAEQMLQRRTSGRVLVKLG